MEDKRQWIDEVLQSMEGSSRAKPRPELFFLIEEQLGFSETVNLKKPNWRFVAVAAILVFVMNISALIYYDQNDYDFDESTQIENTYSQSLISNYQIYD